MDITQHGRLVRDKRSGELYIFCGVATEEDHRKYGGLVNRKYTEDNPFYAIADKREEDFLLWSNRERGFIFIAKSIAHLYIENVELDKDTMSVTEKDSDAQN